MIAIDLAVFEDKAELLKVLGHPTRLAIVQGLMHNKCNVSKIQECLGIPQPTVSTHLRILRDAGIIEGRRQGPEICYEVISQEAKRLISVLIPEPILPLT